MATFLITGVAGFIGSNLASFLLTEGHRVIGLDNFSGGLKDTVDGIYSRFSDGFTFVEGDISNIDCCHSVCEGVDFVLHQAALGSVPRSIKEPVLYQKNNIEGTLNMLVAARDAKVKRFVFASSSSVYGDTPTLPKHEEMPLLPKSPYAVTKATGELYCRMFYQSYGLETISLRYFNVFGPRQNPNSQYAAVVPKFITAYLTQESPTIYGDGEQTRDFTFIDNVINANVNACLLDYNYFGNPINIGCGGRISVNDLSYLIKELVQSDLDPVYESSRLGDVRDSLASIALAQKYLGLKEVISLKQGLKKTLSWYRESI